MSITPVIRDVLETPEYRVRLERTPQLRLTMPRVDGECIIDCLGGRTRRDYLAMSEDDWKHHSFGGILDAFAPSFSEDYFDWLDLIDAVARSSAPFTMAELDAGYERWLVHGGNLCRLLERPLTLLVGCEAEPTHHAWMLEHLQSNGYAPQNHRLLAAAISGAPGSLPFYVGSAASWYGQSIAANRIKYGKPLLPDLSRLIRRLTGTQRPMETIVNLKAITLEDAIGDLDRIDFLHMDIQGAEYDVLRSATDLIDAEVGSIHVGTHSPDVEATQSRDMDALVNELFTQLNWRLRTRVKPRETVARSGIRITFVDGVHSWENPRIVGSKTK